MSASDGGGARDALVVDARDTVAVALRDLDAGASVRAGDIFVRVQNAIPRGHKFALCAIAPGESVVKFGDAIGRASAPIQVGEHVHTHNLQSALSEAETYAFTPAASAATPPAPALTFNGYRRADGRVGTRNEIWVIATVGCVANVCQQIATRANLECAGNVDGVFAITHPYGCSQLGDDLDGTRTILAALAANPNAGGVVLVGLGCESNQLADLVTLAQLDSRRVRTVLSQAVADETEAGLTAVRELTEEIAQDQRTVCSTRDLVVGLKCGGSDGFSGLTANPLLGALTNRVVGAGGAAILTEIPEIFGAERLLMARAANRDVFDKLGGVVNEFKRYFLDHGQRVDENPSPGNKAGGITTLEEKSLGAVQKAGDAVVADVIRYGAQTRTQGLTVLESPGNDAVSSTALAAAGATLIVFTTGRGTPLGFPTPTIKVASNSDLARRKPHWIDFDAGVILEGEPMQSVTDRFIQYTHAVASGLLTRAEENGERTIAIWKRGVTL